MQLGSVLGTEVRLNIYDINLMTELLNWLILRDRQMGIFHCGVEVHGREYSFVLVHKDHDLKTAVVSCEPRKFHHYKYCETINIGWTDTSLEKMVETVTLLASEWSVSPYHITRHNCLLFSEAFVEKIGLGGHFPQWLKNSCVTAAETPGISSFVDSSWEFTKWYMTACKGVCNSRTCQCRLVQESHHLACKTCLPVGRPSCQEGKNEIGCLDVVVGDEEMPMPAFCRTNTREYDTLDTPAWRNYLKRWNGFYGVSAYSHEAYCIVHSFTRLEAGKAEVCFEVRTSHDSPKEDPTRSRLSWHEGFSLPTLRTVVCDHKRKGSVTTGILVYEGVPDELLEGGEEFVFQYGSEGFSSIILRTNMADMGDSDDGTSYI